MDLYSYCGGDPVNNFDPDGRLGKNYIERQAGEAVGAGNFALDTVESLPEILYQGSPLALPEHFEEGYTALQNPSLAVEQRWQAVKSAYQSASRSIQSEWSSGSFGQGKIVGFGGALIGSVFIPGLDEARVSVGVEKVTSGVSTAAEGGADLVSTGNLGGNVLSESHLSDLGEYLGQNGFTLKVGDQFLPPNANGAFSASERLIVLGDNPTEYEALHELQHFNQFQELGPEAYSAQTTAEKEQYVFDSLESNHWDSLNFEEQQHAIWYVNKSGGFR
jgi:hypothetical protein